MKSQRKTHLKMEDIPDIVQPSVNGLIELGQRMLQRLRILQRHTKTTTMVSLRQNHSGISRQSLNGKQRVICLHAEDVMLYGSQNAVPNDEKLLKLHESVMSKVNTISWSHCSLAAVASKPKLVSKLSEIILQKQAWWGAEIGLETGSANLPRKSCLRKRFRLKPEEWPQVARQGFGIMHDHKLIPAATLIVGLPEETEDDIIKTMELWTTLKIAEALSCRFSLFRWAD